MSTVKFEKRDLDEPLRIKIQLVAEKIRFSFTVERHEHLRFKSFLETPGSTYKLLYSVLSVKGGTLCVENTAECSYFGFRKEYFELEPLLPLLFKAFETVEKEAEIVHYDSYSCRISEEGAIEFKDDLSREIFKFDSIYDCDDTYYSDTGRQNRRNMRELVRDLRAGTGSILFRNGGQNLMKIRKAKDRFVFLLREKNQKFSFSANESLKKMLDEMVVLTAIRLEDPPSWEKRKRTDL